MTLTRRIRLGEQTQGELPHSQLAISWKPPVRVATTAAGTLATSFDNGDTIDGVALVTGNRILIKNQATTMENGIYVVQSAAGGPLRATDFDLNNDNLGAVVLVRLGTVNAAKLFVCTQNIPPVFAELVSAAAPTTADYLVGTAQAGLSAEIVVGATPGGELGGTWASPTVDGTHSGSTHAATQAAAEATAASALSGHTGDATDAHDASAISVLDTGGNFSGTEVEAVLAEIWAGITAGGIPATIFDAAGDLIVASAADTAVRLPMGTALQTLRVNAGATGLEYAAPAASGASWTQDVNESGASFANWTAGTGTWASDGTIIAQTDTAAAFQEAKFTAKVATGLPSIIEAEIRFPTTGAGVGATRIGGLTLGFDGADITTGFGVRLSESGDTIDVESANSANIRAIAFTIAKDIYYKLRVVRGSSFCDVYLDGALQGTVRTGSTAFDAVADFVGLYTFGTRVDYRNIKVWTLSGGLPA